MTRPKAHKEGMFPLRGVPCLTCGQPGQALAIRPDHGHTTVIHTGPTNNCVTPADTDTHTGTAQ